VNRLSRLGLAVVLAATLGLGAVACGSSSSSPTAQGHTPSPGALASGADRAGKAIGRLSRASSQQRLAFAQCMRGNGVPHWPDSLPSSGTLASLQALGISISSASVRSAIKACKSKLTG
jgi:hypothetical protein